MAEKKRRPELRFSGFTDPWEQRKLLDCIQKITDFRGRTPKKLGMDWSESGYLALSALNVKDGYIDFSQDVHYGDQALYDKWMSGNELHKGQVLFTTEAPMGNVAQVPDNRRYILSQRTIAFDTKPNLITEKFLATVLRTPTVFAALTALSSGGTAKGVSQKSLATVDITIPADLDEQEQLASMFSRIDNLITLHQRKYEKLVNVKKSMLEKMFPQNGSAYPEVRFSEFTAPWEQRKLSEILIQRVEHQTITADAPLLAFSYAEGVINPEDKKSNKRDFIMTDKYSKIFSLTEKNDIIYNPANVIHGAIHRNKLGRGVVSPIYKIFICEKGSPKYVGERLHTDRFIEELKKYIEGTVIKLRTLSPEKFLELIIEIPVSLEEQEKIGILFEHLDNLITLHQRKLETLKHLKQSMLQKMFV